MNPDSNFGSTEPALPNIPMPLQPGTGAPGMPAAGVPGLGGGIASAAPTVPPPANSWLPPTVPVQAGTGSADSGNGQGSSGVSVAVPAVADDGDIIEKEWVDKAKHIVAQTRQDPYKQARELHQFKAEYLQKRYNKKIEAVED